jgi:asparagine N-glycosylation enzyme membrane subunit Stt3
MQVHAFARWLTSGVTLEGLDSYGTMETLTESLDSDAWKGGTPLLGVFGTDDKLAYPTGTPMAATFVTADGQVDGQRQHITGTRPHIDTTNVTVEISSRERDGDTVTYDTAESMEFTGIVPAWSSGNYHRARVNVAAGVTWNRAKGLDTINENAGDA